MSFNNDKPPKLPSSEEVGDNDEIISDSQVQDYSEILINPTRMLKSIIFLCNHSMLKEYQQVIEKFRAGNKLALFLVIQEMIEKSLERSDFGNFGPSYLKYFNIYIIQDDFKYFLANLINSVYIFSKHFKENSYYYPGIAQEIIERLDYLKVVFNISPTISKLVY